MTARTLIAAALLAALPAASFALCSGRGHQAQSCAPGTVWDANQQQCIKLVNS